MKNPFFSNIAVMVLCHPKELNREAMTADAFPDEALAKIHDFCHHRHRLPVTWLICAQSAERYGDRLRQWKAEYGDEIGIYEPALFGRETVPPGVQTWLDELGVERPAAGNPYGFLCWADVDGELQTRIFSHLKQKFDALFDQDTKVAYAANGGVSTVRAFKAAGLSVMWGYNWNLYGDVVDSTGKGCLPYPFYVSDRHVKAPADRGAGAVLGVHWGSGDLANNFHTARQAHLAMNRCCLNAHELANRSGAVPKHEFIERFYRQTEESRNWNPFAYVPLQIEAAWADEGGVFFGQYPSFNSRTIEIFYHLIETGLRYGAEYLTLEKLREWYLEHCPTTPEMLFWCDDLLPGVTIPGKDHGFQPAVIQGGRDHQRIFLKSSGFNAVRTYRYRPGHDEVDPRLEYPYEMEPDVSLKVKEWTTPSFGVRVTPEGACYASDEWNLTSRKDEPDYAALLWSLNLPEYIAPEELETSPNIRRVRLLPGKNAALVEAALQAGDNELKLFSARPNAFIHMEAPRLSGRRLEIYLHNSGPEAGLSFVVVRIDPWLRLGGVWWDGEYFDSLHYFHHSWYDFSAGDFGFRTAYPQTLRLRPGLTRLSLEVVGKL